MCAITSVVLLPMNLSAQALLERSSLSIMVKYVSVGGSPAF